jgi:hypothetical protein
MNETRVIAILAQSKDVRKRPVYVWACPTPAQFSLEMRAQFKVLADPTLTLTLTFFFRLNSYFITWNYTC